jgi:hypothetical protein
MTPAAMMLALLAFARFARGRRALLRRGLMTATLMTVAIMARAAFFRTSAGPPDFDEFRRCLRCRRFRRGGGFDSSRYVKSA